MKWARKNVRTILKNILLLKMGWSKPVSHQPNVVISSPTKELPDQLAMAWSSLVEGEKISII
jgi:hypothetical protein